MRTTLRSKLTLLFMAFSLMVALPAVALADDISNNLDNSVDAVAETISLNTGGPNGTTQLYVIQRNGDGKNGCNLTGGTELKISLSSNNTSVATVSPSNVTFTSCSDTPTVTVTPHNQGTATISASQVSNTTDGSFNLAPVNFTVNVAPPPNTPPQVAVQGVNGGASYEKGSVPAATCQVTDAEDGNKSFPATIDRSGLNQYGLGQETASCSYTDNGGLRASASETYNVIDSGAPNITDLGAMADADGDNGWYKSAVANQFRASDAGAGFVGKTNPHTFTQSSGADEGGAVRIHSGPVADAAGNTNPGINSAAFKIDLSDPTIEASLDKPAAPSGWFNIATGAPTVSYLCRDAISGIAQCPQNSTFGNGANQSDSGVAKDVAGRTKSGGVSGINVDLIAPTSPNADFDRPAEDSADNWFKNAATVSYSGSTDQGSGLKGYSASQTFNTSGSHSYSGNATDNAGNESQATTGAVKVDATNPALNVSCPAAPVIKGSTASANWTASDQHSGLATAQNGSVALDTSSVGSRTATVPAGAAQDKVGLGSAAATCTYSTVYDFKGFFQPIDNKDANGNFVFNKAKAGSTIPVKFSLGGDQGMDILLSTPSTVSVTAPVSASTDLIEETTTATSGLKYDAVANQYVYNWKTDAKWAGTSRQLVVKLADGTIQRANFSFTK